jgi:hypothetical protein
MDWNWPMTGLNSETGLQCIKKYFDSYLCSYKLVSRDIIRKSSVSSHDWITFPFFFLFQNCIKITLPLHCKDCLPCIKAPQFIGIGITSLRIDLSIHCLSIDSVSRSTLLYMIWQQLVLSQSYSVTGFSGFPFYSCSDTQCCAWFHCAQICIQISSQYK